MAPPYDIAALIETLKKLYSRVAAVTLQKRLDSHPRDKGAGVDHDISAPLSDHIERLAATKQRDGQEKSRDAASPREAAATQTSSKSRRPASGGQPPKSSWTFKELARFLGRRRTGSTLQPHVSHKLQASVWEHLNTSLRLARQGEAQTARLHADVANNALKEAARYLPEDEYAEFYGQVEKRLKEIRAEIDAAPPAAGNDVG